MNPGVVRPLDAAEEPRPAEGTAEPPEPAPADGPSRPPLDLEASRRALEDRQDRWLRYRAEWEKVRARRRSPPGPTSVEAAPPP